MKKSMYGFVVVSILTLEMSAYGQDFYAGITGGLNLADLKTTIADPTIINYDTKSRTLFGVGGFLGISVNEFLSVQLEPMYVAKGGIYTEPTVPEMKIKSSQIDLPLLATLGIGEKVRPFITAGPFVSFLLDASLSAELAGRVWEGDFLQVLKRTEFGVVFGGGVGFAMLNGSAFIEGRYALGLTNFNKGGSFDLRSGNLVAGRFTTDPKDELKTRGILVMIGYQLPLGGK
jgi:hypothetical protein